MRSLLDRQASYKIMFLFELIKDATANLGRHKLRTSLTMLGMIFGVAAVLAMLSIGAGAEEEAAGAWEAEAGSSFGANLDIR